MRKFGFGDKFNTLIERMRASTTVRFAVDGEVSAKCRVRSGIKQGSPLAPLLFVIAVETLALAVQHSDAISGVTPKTTSMHHKISSFVDDSAVFLGAGRELPKLTRLLYEYGDLSGLRGQPEKIVYICLNTARQQDAVNSIPMLKPDLTVRYLGVHVGVGETTEANWSERLRKLRSRLHIVSAMETSTPSRVLIQNAVMLPAVLFTARWVRELERSQEAFLWTTDHRNHKSDTRSTLRWYSRHSRSEDWGYDTSQLKSRGRRCATRPRGSWPTERSTRRHGMRWYTR